MRRRSFLQGSVLGAFALKAQGAPQVPRPDGPRKKLAAITPAYTMRSNADNLITRFLQGYWIDNEFHQPSCDIASLYIDQVSEVDIGRRISAAYGLPVTQSISDALTLGTGRLAVDGVLLVGDESGSPASDATPQRDWRFDSFTQVVNEFKKSGRSVPVFCYGYLSTDWDQAQRMYQQSREIGFPLMAGSSVPVTFRRPELDYHLPVNYDDTRLGDRAHHSYPLGVDFDDALVIAPGGEASDAMFSSLEILQSFLERRKAGESGIRSLERFVDSAVWRAAEEGRWSKEVMLAALGRAERLGKGRPEDVEHPAVWLIEYNDGTRGAILSLGGLVSEYLAAFRIKGRREIDSTLCYTPVESSNDFSMLVQGISNLMVSGTRPYPVERTLLTSGAFSFLRESVRNGRQKIETPMLQIAYAAPGDSFYAHGRGW